MGSWFAPRRTQPREGISDPGPAASVEQQWTDLDWRAAKSRYEAACQDWPLETLPISDPWLGPGSMALYLGSEPDWQPDTVWYRPSLDSPESAPPVRFDPENPWWRVQTELTDRMIEASGGRYYVGCPDMVENWDVLAALRDAQVLLMDMLDQPAWVEKKIEEINQAWFQVYDRVYDQIRQQDGESMFGWFRTWAPGKVAKVQCDGASMFSPEMFRRFVVPALSNQCAFLDYSLFHLDGSQCLGHLDALLEIEELTAIEWTPDPKVPTGGSPHWYGMYRKILAAGKRVQVLDARPEEIEPLLDAVGGDGIYFLSSPGDQLTAERYLETVERLRS